MDLLSEINALPTDWIPNESPSKVVEKIQDQKKHCHEIRLYQLREQIDGIKIDMDLKMRHEAMKLRTNILNIKLYIEENIKRYTFDFEKTSPSGPHHLGIYKTLTDFVATNCNSMKALIHENNDNLKDLEAKRLETLKNILQVARFDFENVAYKTHQEISADFEVELLQINQSALNNHYTYSELRAQLLNMVLSSESMWYKKVNNLHMAYERQLLAGRANINVTDLTVEQVKQFAEEVSKKMYKLFAECQGAIITLRDILILIQSGRYDEQQQLKTTLVGIPKQTYLEILKEIYESLYEEMSFEQITGHTLEMMTKWTEAVRKMEAEVEICKAGVNSGTHVWDKHYLRRFEITELFAMDLCDCVTKSDDEQNAKLIELNATIDVLRTSPDIETLKGNMGICQTLMNTIKANFAKIYETHLNYFQKFREMMIQESHILFLEMSYFVKCYPNLDDVNPTIFRGRRSRIAIVLPAKKAHVLKEFDADILAMHNWIYGVAEVLKTKTKICSQASMEYANNWTDAATVVLYRNFQLKMDLMKEMYQRIFHHVYRIRLAELLFHKQRLRQHILATDKELEDMCQASQTGEEVETTIYSTYIIALEAQANKMKKNVKDCNHSSMIIAMVQEHQSFKKTCLEGMAQVRTEIDERNEKRINELIFLNVAYASNIRTFGELGDYHIDELDEMKDTFAEINTHLVKTREIIVNNSEVMYNNALKEVEDIEERLTATTNSTTEKFQFKEFIKTHIADLRSKLKEETSILIDDSNMISSYLLRLESLAEANIGNFDYLDDFADNCKYMQEIFVGHYYRLRQNKIFELEANLFIPPIETMDVEDVGPAGTVITRNIQMELGLELGEDGVLEDFGPVRKSKVEDELFKLVFPEVPEGDDYMSNIIQILVKSLQTLQDHAHEHFQALLSNESITEDRKQKYACKLKTFMINYLATHLYYQMQCDEILLEITINYILEMDELLSFIMNYYKASMQIFVEKTVFDLSSGCTLYKTKINAQRAKVDAEYEQIVGELKPLHGHPRNKDLLEKLAEKMNIMEDQAIIEQASMDQLFEEYQTQVENNNVTFDSHFEKMEVCLGAWVKNFTDMYVEDEAIFEQVRRKLDYFDMIMQHNSKIVDSDSSHIDIDIADKMNHKLGTLKQYLRISSNDFTVKLRAKYANTKAVRERYSSSKHTEIVNSLSLDCLQIKDDFERDQQACIQELKDSKEILQLCAKWTNIFKGNVAMINSLYEVEYVPVPPAEMEIEKPPKEKPKKKKK